MFPQDQYGTQLIGQPGDIITAAPNRVRSFKANGAIPFGVAVVHLVADSDDLVAVPPTPAVDADSIIAVGVSAAGIQDYVPDGAAALDFDGARGGKALQYGYLLEMVCNAHNDWNATSAQAWGYDCGGSAIYDEIPITADIGGTFLAVREMPFRVVTHYRVPAQTGANGTFTLGNQAGIRQVAAVGIAVRNQALQADAYADGDEVLVLTFGQIWVRPTGVASGSVYSGQRATVRATAGVGERYGEISNVVDGGDNGYWPRARFLDDATVYHATTNPNAVVALEVM